MYNHDEKVMEFYYYVNSIHGCQFGREFATYSEFAFKSSKNSLSQNKLWNFSVLSANQE